MSKKVTHFRTSVNEPVTLEVKREKWFALFNNPGMASFGVLEMTDGTVRTAHVYRSYDEGPQYRISPTGRLPFWPVVNATRSVFYLEGYFEHSVRNH